MKKWLIGSFSNPRGIGGRIAGWIMGHRASNVRRSRWAVELLDVQRGERFLEVGCGPGVALAAAKQRTADVVGVDQSPVMVRTARRRSGATVIEASASALPRFDEPFDKALAVNTLAFWPDPVGGLRAIRDRLRDGATIAIVSQPRGGAFTDNDEVQRQLTAAGFTIERLETLAIEPPAVCVLATA
jgi:SAM-dependent methyltransferase